MAKNRNRRDESADNSEDAGTNPFQNFPETQLDAPGLLDEILNSGRAKSHL